MRNSRAWRITYKIGLSKNQSTSKLPGTTTSAQDVVLLTSSSTGEIAVELLLEYLAVYDLAPSVQVYNSEKLTARARGRALIAAATQAGADHLIMGAFGESQSGAIAGLGRATRKVVTGAPMAVVLQS